MACYQRQPENTKLPPIHSTKKQHCKNKFAKKQHYFILINCFIKQQNKTK
ncbi:hypothetical protein GCWU000324_03138 [Kingella oralis ATCC 51147]|uniref:Uncharacterized protein n=1 Tax=Kingella oralis ATCC 51147 TaxID=629741 RepID=C4GN49_9NEIS|nr:hypothetical protein GCWU000324_03138 [Kingella oralis ATCC 51147]